MTRTRAFLAVVAILLLAIAYNTFKTLSVASRVSRDEHTTCVIQVRGLGQQKYLVGSLDDLHQILKLPPTAAGKREERTLPKRELRHELRLLKKLDGNLAGYVNIAHKQPKSRAC